MKRLLLPVVLLIASAATCTSLAAVLTVDDDGGADYLTIQEAADAASWGDTVLVHPGTYVGFQDCYGLGFASVCLPTNLILMSSGGPEVTVIDGEGWTSYGVVSMWGDPIVVEGFTITNGWVGSEGVSAVGMATGEVSGNILTGYGVGVHTDPYWYAGRSEEPATGTRAVRNSWPSAISSGPDVFSHRRPQEHFRIPKLLV